MLFAPHPRVTLETKLDREHGSPGCHLDRCTAAQADATLARNTYRFCSRIAPVGQLRSQAMSRVHS